MFITVVGVSHKTTPVEIREKLTFDNDQAISASRKLKDTKVIAGCVILSTCNRTEIYTVSKNSDVALSEVWDLLSEKSGISIEQLQKYIYNIKCEQAIAHLFRVASGLDSMILGEMEILGQIARAYKMACENSASNVVLNVLFQKAIKVGKQVRTETRIGNGASSVGSAAVELVKQTFGRIQDCYILLIGAGEIGRVVARNLANNEISEVMVCNRSYNKACELAGEFNGCAIPFEDLFEYMIDADVILACTSALDYVITKENLTSIMELRDDRHLLLIDLAVPRNIDPDSSQLENISLYNIDDLQEIVDQSLGQRRLEAEKAEIILENTIDNFLKWLNNFHAVPVIKALHQKGEEIGDSEVNKAIRKLGHLTEREEKILHSMAHAIASKLINAPISQLREYASTKQGYMYVQMAMNLFNIPAQPDEQSSYPQTED